MLPPLFTLVVNKELDIEWNISIPEPGSAALGSARGLYTYKRGDP